jgi:hypothetical protein
MSKTMRRSLAALLAVLTTCLGVALASPASAAITIAYTIVPTLGAVTTLKASIIACGSTVTSCSVTIATSVNKCEEKTALSGLSTAKTYDGTVQPSVLGFSLGAFNFSGAKATYSQTSYAYKTCTTGTTSQTCTVAGGSSAYLKTKFLYKNSSQAVTLKWVNPIIGTFKTINDTVYITKPYSTYTLCS